MKKHSPFAKDYVVLIVDREVSYRDLLKGHLVAISRDIPLVVHEADSGHKAIELLRNGCVDCVLIDYFVPGGDGMALLKDILERWRDLSVIVLADAGSESAAFEAMRLGAVDYLIKGRVTPDDLQRALFSALQKSNMRGMLRRQQDELVDSEKNKVLLEDFEIACRDMAQPMTTVDKCIGVLEKEHLTGVARDNLRAARQAVDTMREVVRRLKEVHKNQLVH